MAATKKQIETINRAFWAVEKQLETTHNWDRYVAQNIAESKAHDRFRPAGIRNGLPLRAQARLFSVQQLFEREPGSKTFTVEDVFHVRLACLQAQALRKLYVRELAAIKDFKDIQDVLEMDFSILNRVDD